MLGEAKLDRVSVRREAVRREILAAAWQLAREQGLAQLTLRDVAARVSMQPPSLYSHFASKNAIYDAMFAQAWTDCLTAMTAAHAQLLIDRPEARAALRRIGRTFFEFAVADLARHQLMNQRVIAGFAPSPEAYQPAVETLDLARRALADLGITAERHVDLYVALVGGLIDAQQANDPGGRRWARLVDDAMDMFADHVGLPPETPRTTTRGKK